MERYLVAIKDNHLIMGSDGMLRTDYKQNWRIMQIAESWAWQRKHDEVYLLNDFTQQMCEMSNDDVVKHIRKNGLKVY